MAGAAGDLAGRVLAGDPRTTRRLAVLTFLAGLGWAAVMLWRSPGAPTHDEIAHYLIARHAWTDPLFILNVWGRVGYTLVFMPAAAVSWPASRVFALGLSCLTVLLAMRLARQLGVRFHWSVPLFCWFQPWFANLSFAALTEVPFSLLGVVGASLALDGRMVLAGLAFGLLPLVRHEGLLMVGLFAILCAARRQWPAVIAGGVPLAAYNVLSHLVRGNWPFEVYLHPKRPDIFDTGTGGWLHYFGPLLGEIGLPVAVLAVLGIAAMHRSNARLLVFAGYGAYLAMHVAVYHFSLFNSGGRIRFLFPLAPIIAIAAALGLEVALRALGGQTPPRPPRRALAGLLLAGTAVAVMGVGLAARPHRVDREQRLTREAADWLHQEGLDRQQVVSTHAWLHYYLALPAEPGASRPPRLDMLGVGTVVIWDKHYSESWGLPRNRLEEPGGNWELVRVFGKDAVLVFQKR